MRKFAEFDLYGHRCPYVVFFRSMKVTRKAIAQTVECLLETDARKATSYLDEKTVVTATRRHRPDKRANYVEVVMKLGKPNFRERAFIKSCKRAGEAFPVKKVQLKFYPEPKKRRTKTKRRK